MLIWCAYHCAYNCRTQSSSDNFPSYSPDNQHCSNVVCWTINTVLIRLCSCTSRSIDHLEWQLRQLSRWNAKCWLGISKN